jgi:hypothetical protein
MRPQRLPGLGLVKAAFPYLWGFAAASAADYVVDVKNLFLPALAGEAALSASIMVVRRAAPQTRNLAMRSFRQPPDPLPR